MAVALLRDTVERTVLLEVGTDPDVRAVLRRRLARLVAVDHANLARLRRIGERPEGFLLGYEVDDGAASFDDLARRCRPSIAETVGVGLAVCQALAALHAAGLAHGAVTDECVLIAPDGAVQLADAGCCPDPVRAACTADDVVDLARLLASWMPAAGPTLRALLARACDRDRPTRPRLVDVGLALERECAPEPFAPHPGSGTPGSDASAPIRSDACDVPAPAAGGAASPRPRRSRPAGRPRHALPAVDAPRPERPALRPSRRGLVLGAAAVIGVTLLAGGTVGLVSAGQRPVVPAFVTAPQVASSPTASYGVPTPGPGAESPDWLAVLRSLDGARARAMAASTSASTEAALALVDDPGGQAYRRDLAAARARGRAGLRLAGGVPTIRSVRPVAVAPYRVELRVVDERAPYRLLDASGRTVLAEPGRGPIAWRVVLTPHGSSWRVYDATRSS